MGTGRGDENIPIPQTPLLARTGVHPEATPFMTRKKGIWLGIILLLIVVIIAIAVLASRGAPGEEEVFLKSEGHEQAAEKLPPCKNDEDEDFEPPDPEEVRRLKLLLELAAKSEEEDEEEGQFGPRRRPYDDPYYDDSNYNEGGRVRRPYRYQGRDRYDGDDRGRDGYWADRYGDNNNQRGPQDRDKKRPSNYGNWDVEDDEETKDNDQPPEIGASAKEESFDGEEQEPMDNGRGENRGGPPSTNDGLSQALQGQQTQDGNRDFNDPKVNAIKQDNVADDGPGQKFARGNWDESDSNGDAYFVGIDELEKMKRALDAFNDFSQTVSKPQNDTEEEQEAEAAPLLDEIKEQAGLVEVTDATKITAKGAIELGEGGCPEDTIKCNSTNECYFPEEKCDGTVHCGDFSDETTDCSCKHYLFTDKICDGTEDCPNGVDEKNCYCENDEFSCGGSESDCIDDSLVCNNVFNCDGDGLDEQRCVGLVPLLGELSYPDVSASPYIDGVLNWRVGGTFYPLSIETTEEIDSDGIDYLVTNFAQKVCENILPGINGGIPTFKKMGAQNQTSRTVAHLVINSVAPVAGTNYPGGTYSFDLKDNSDSDGFMLSITCPEPDCGVRATVAARNAPKAMGVSKTDESSGDGEDDEDESSSDDEDESSSDDEDDSSNDDEDGSSGSGQDDSSGSGQDSSSRRKRSDEETDEEADEEAVSFKERIVGGKDSVRKNWPAMAAVFRDGEFICGATVVAVDFIVTAAHCLENFDKLQFHYNVVVGGIRKSSLSPMQYSRVIDKIAIHEDFNNKILMNDIALAKVNMPFLINAHTGIACLPEGEEFDVNVNSTCVAAGWGSKGENEKAAEHLQEAQIPIFDDCTKTYNEIEKQICGGYHEGGIDSCQGDSGGPLFCEHPQDPDRYFLGGIISHGEGCARPETPGVYVRVAHYLPWIKQEMIAMSQRSDTSTKIPRRDCPTHECDGVCLEKTKLCDKKIDCKIDRSDEINCFHDSENKYVFQPPSEGESVKTKSAFVPHRPHKSHNMVAHAHPIQSRTCKPGYFKCKTVHQCIAGARKCNLVPDCVDFSDERDCKCKDFLVHRYPHKKCDSYPDCPGWEDERQCKYCSQPDSFYCDLSKQCIPRSKVCDQKPDCKLGEDERYCFNLLKTGTVFLKLDGRPKRTSKGFVAYSNKNQWALACVTSWNDDLNNKLCNYVGYRKALNYITIPSANYPNYRHRILDIRYENATKPIFDRSLIDPQADGGRKKRDASSSCSYVETTCADSSLCGTMPLYSRQGVRTPLKGRGTFPWQVTLYRQGEYFCGATLVHSYWILTSTKCANKKKANDWIIARAGGYLDQFSLSAHDQLRRVVHFSSIPGTSISLGFLDKPFEMTEYVNVVCIPTVSWLPIGKGCVITGKHEDVLNHVVTTRISNTCEFKNQNQYSFCTKQDKPTNDCLKNWSGALVCPDNTGTFYAVGVYHAERANCKFSDEKNPAVFETLVSASAREGIIALIRTAVGNSHPFANIPDNCETVRCPLGNCLNPEQVCDGIVHCSDMADELPSLCKDRIKMCDRTNATHCMCGANDLLCSNGMCLDKSKFCDGTNNCGDSPSTDEPANCATSCTVGLTTLHPKKLCNGHVDCSGRDDFGDDEGATLCCPRFGLPATTTTNNNGGLFPSTSAGVVGEYSYRCAIGTLDSGSTSNAVAISDQCIPSTSVCDWDKLPNRPKCENGADELDCVSIWPEDHKTSVSRDPFGRYLSQVKGYLYFVAYGRKYLYCASLFVFQKHVQFAYGDAICRHEGYPGVIDIALHEPRTRRRIMSSMGLSSTEQAHYDACHLVYITCQGQRKYYY